MNIIIWQKVYWQILQKSDHSNVKEFDHALASSYNYITIHNSVYI